MEIRIDFRSGQPIYSQIVDQIHQKLASGQLKAGDQLPTVRQLATDLRVNFNTVARAYRILDEAGLISTQHGRGTYVWETPTAEATQILRKQNLHDQIEHFFVHLLSQGYSTTEIAPEITITLRKILERSK